MDQQSCVNVTGHPATLRVPSGALVAQAGKAAGTPIVLKDYARFQLGEGIEKEETDFAAEVAAAVAG